LKDIIKKFLLDGSYYDQIKAIKICLSLLITNYQYNYLNIIIDSTLTITSFINLDSLQRNYKSP